MCDPIHSEASTKALCEAVHRRVLCRIPGPQEEEQELHSLQHVHSPLQACSLQVLSKVEVPVHVPLVHVRWRNCLPPSQGSSHLVHSPQSDHPPLLSIESCEL